MQFTLIYDGPLSPSSTPKQKHDIRKQLHKQLKSLWASEAFHGIVIAGTFKEIKAQSEALVNEIIEKRAKKFPRCGIEFVPLVTGGRNLSCSLDILFLRRDPPGTIIAGGAGGDIDNRLKILFDSFQLPPEGTKIGGADPDECPFFVLLEDDALITSVKVSAGRLLRPALQPGGEDDVLLIMNVDVWSINSGFIVSTLFSPLE